MLCSFRPPQAFVLVLQVAGLFVGMVSLGFAVDRIGRKIGSIFTAVVMIIGEVIGGSRDSSLPWCGLVTSYALWSAA